MYGHDCISLLYAMCMSCTCPEFLVLELMQGLGLICRLATRCSLHLVTADQGPPVPYHMVVGWPCPRLRQLTSALAALGEFLVSSCWE
jgi:hypothetical protein